MKRRKDKGLHVGLDIGTTKVVALVGDLTAEGELNIIGVGSHPSKGLKRGVVVNIESTIDSIQSAIEQAEQMAGCQIHSAYTGIAGAHIRSLNSHGIVPIRGTEVTHTDIERVIDAAKAVAIPADQKVLHVLPQEYVVDGQDGIREPIGMSGVRLEANVHIITGSVSAAQNIVKCVERCGLQVSDIVLEQLASSYAVLTEDEKELGVCMIDIGGGTTDVAVFLNGAIRHTAVIPIAGDQVTSDIAIALRTPSQHAEKIKVDHACVVSASVDPKTHIEVPRTGKQAPKQVSKHLLAEVVEARYEELLHIVKEELTRSGFIDLISSGIVLTGGASKAEGLTDLADSIFQMPVRLGQPQNIQGPDAVVTNPIYATGIGLLVLAKEQSEQLLPRVAMGAGNVKRVFTRMRSWFHDSF